MNDSEQSSVQLFWSIQEIIAHIELHGTLHKKWMFRSRVVFNHFDQFKKLSHTLRFIAHCVRNEWFSEEFCLTFLVALWQYSIFREMWEIGWKMSEYNKRYVQILWWLGEVTLEIDAHNALHMKKLFLSPLDPTISVDSIKCIRDGNFAQNHVIKVGDEAAFSSASSASW